MKEKNTHIKTPRGYINSKTLNKKPLPSYNMNREYDFLTHYRLVEKWVLSNYEITRNQLQMVLYLYKKSVFTKNQFDEYHKVLGIYSFKTLLFLLEEGWVDEWFSTDTKSYTQYVLSRKSKMLCKKMHRMCTGEEDIPVRHTNKMTKSKKRIDEYYLKEFSKVNKENEGIEGRRNQNKK